MASKILSGRKEIQNFTGRRWEIIQRWIMDENFPSKKLDGVWESDSDLILSWRREQIQKRDVNSKSCVKEGVKIPQ